ncbi:lipopolysaccharide heptosyltransferase I [Pseudothioglobus sp. nBUS_23]|uniref:lipopolysaccharide heptosyltransferase I n=1 Tax=Pseudothioglobus sp. nBUS_23 TaxID=3395318 RepID=UPI003EBDF6FA
MRIAIVKLSALGDIVHAMIVLQFIKNTQSDISIDWIVEKKYKELLESNPDIDSVHSISLKRAKKKQSILAFFKAVRKVRKLQKYDLVIDMQGLIKSALISRLIPSKLTIGFDKFSIREKAASIFYNTTFNCPYEKNIIERNISIVEFAMGITIYKKQILNKLPFLFSHSNNLTIKVLNSKKNIILIPGASDDLKRYPARKLAKLTELIDANFLIIWGSYEEKIIGEQIKNLSNNTTVCNRTTLDDLISLISKAHLVIGPDTGPTHIAWALNIPSITIFGPTPGYRNTFMTDINKIIESESEVNPFKISKNDFSIANIDEEEIVKMANSLLKLG